MLTLCLGSNVDKHQQYQNFSQESKCDEKEIVNKIKNISQNSQVIGQVQGVTKQCSNVVEYFKTWKQFLGHLDICIYFQEFHETASIAAKIQIEMF